MSGLAILGAGAFGTALAVRWRARGGRSRSGPATPHMRRTCAATG
jgi:glycerol-3-phosphate dehydrogenase